MEPLQFGLWIFSRGNTKWKEKHKRESKRIKGQKQKEEPDDCAPPLAMRTMLQWLQQSTKEGETLQQSVATRWPLCLFCCCFCLKHQLSDIHTRHVWYDAAVRPSRMLVHRDPGAVLSVSLVTASSDKAEPKVQSASSVCPLVSTQRPSCLRWAEGYHQDKEGFFFSKKNTKKINVTDMSECLWEDCKGASWHTISPGNTSMATVASLQPVSSCHRFFFF